MSIRLDHGEDTLGVIHEINVTPFIDVSLGWRRTLRVDIATACASARASLNVNMNLFFDFKSRDALKPKQQHGLD
jgi:biopolymer transport protein ExbD